LISEGPSPNNFYVYASTPSGGYTNIIDTNSLSGALITNSSLGDGEISISVSGRLIGKKSHNYPVNGNEVLTLGWAYDDEYWDGDIAEVLVFNKKLSEQKNIDINYYLSKKWGLTSTIDSDGDGVKDEQDSNPIKYNPEPVTLFWDVSDTSPTTNIPPSNPNLDAKLTSTSSSPRSWGYLTRWFGSHYPYIEFTVSKTTELISLEFKHYHNHNPGYSTYPNYNVVLQIDSGTGFNETLGSALNVSKNNYGSIDTIDLGSKEIGPGTYKLRWYPKNLNGGRGAYTHTHTEWLTIDEVKFTLK